MKTKKIKAILKKKKKRILKDHVSNLMYVDVDTAKQSGPIFIKT